jgi:Family of unknown function (DUF6427)
VVGIFKSNNPSGNFVLLIYALVLKLPIFLHYKAPTLQKADGVLYKGLLHLLEPISSSIPFIYSIFTFILLLAQAIGINKIVNDLRLHKQTNYLTGMSFLLITSLFTDWFNFSAPLIVNTFLIWIWARLCSLYNNPSAKSSIFNIGLATGLTSFIYFPSISFLVLVMVGIAISRPFRLQEWLTGFAGIITPVYFFLAYLFLTNNMASFHFAGFSFSYPHFMGNKYAYIALVLLFITTAVGFYFVNINMRRQIVQTRKSWQLLFLYTAVAALVPFVNATIDFSYWILLAVPISPIIAAAFFYPQKKAFPLLLHWVLFALFILVNFIAK